MHKFITVIVTVLVLLSCSREYDLPAGLRAGGFRIADTNKQELTLKQMTENSIPYKINERGFVIYLQKDKAKVLGILRKIQHGNELTNTVIESEVVIDATHRKLLTSKFEQQGIPYSLKTHNGVESIHWVQLYGPKVDLILQEVGFERFQHATKNLVN